MELVWKMILGFFVGILCGLVPFIYGFIKANRKLAAVSIILTALSGLLFSVLDKSPFSAFVVAIMFVVINIASNKRKSLHNQDDNEDGDDIS